jgi:hypothetical protein
MDHSEILKECDMTYDELIKYLLHKYGTAKYDYFKNDINYKMETYVFRSDEGLYCHHIDEDKGDLLSEAFSAKMSPFRWQRKDRLVYCNLLEHLLLHLKIIILRQKYNNITNALDFRNNFGSIQNGVKFICEDYVDLLISSYKKNLTRKQQKYLATIDNNYDDFISILHAFFHYMELQIAENTNKSFFRNECSIIINNQEYNFESMSYDDMMITVKNDLGKKELDLWSVKSCLPVIDWVEIYKLNVLYELKHSLYHDICLKSNDEEITRIINGFYKDFNGFGFPEFSKILIDREKYGASNIDEYISYAFPSYCDMDVDLSNCKPYMWEGNVPDKVLEDDCFFIVRIETSFTLKDGEEPCVRLKKPDIFHKWDDLFSSFYCNRLGERLLDDDENNKRVQMGKLICTSDYYDEKTDRFCSMLKDKYGRISPITVKLSLTYNDLLLFNDRYDIRGIKYLDGCCFWKQTNRID